jgi:hypothetical protein
LDSDWQEGIQYNLHTVDEVLASKLSGIAAPQVQEVKTETHVVYSLKRKTKFNLLKEFGDSTGY